MADWPHGPASSARRAWCVLHHCWYVSQAALLPKARGAPTGSVVRSREGTFVRLASLVPFLEPLPHRFNVGSTDNLSAADDPGVPFVECARSQSPGRCLRSQGLV